MGSKGQIPLNFFESVRICDGAPLTAHSSILLQCPWALTRINMDFCKSVGTTYLHTKVVLIKNTFHQSALFIYLFLVGHLALALLFFANQLTRTATFMFIVCVCEQVFPHTCMTLSTLPFSGMLWFDNI